MNTACTNKRKIDCLDQVELPPAKLSKTNIDYFEASKKVLILTRDKNDDVTLQLYEVPESLCRIYEPIFAHLKRKSDAHKPPSKWILSHIGHLEDVRYLYQRSLHPERISVADIWFNALCYWRDRGIVSWLTEDVALTRVLNVINVVTCSLL